MNNEEREPAKDAGKLQRIVWLWVMPRGGFITNLAGGVAMMLTAALLSYYKESLFFAPPWLGWLAYFALIGVAGALAEIIVGRLLKERNSTHAQDEQPR